MDLAPGRGHPARISEDDAWRRRLFGLTSCQARRPRRPGISTPQILLLPKRKPRNFGSPDKLAPPFKNKLDSIFGNQ